MFSQFDDSEIAASDGPFDVVETYSDGIRFVAGRLFSSTATTGTTTATCSASSFLHLHHLTSFMEVSMLVDEVTRPRVLLSNQKQPIKSSFPSSLLSQLLQSVAVEWMGNLPVGQLIPLNSFVTRSTCIFFEDLFSLSSCLSFCFLLMMVSLVGLFGFDIFLLFNWSSSFTFSIYLYPFVKDRRRKSTTESLCGGWVVWLKVFSGGCVVMH